MGQLMRFISFFRCLPPVLTLLLLLLVPPRISSRNLLCEQRPQLHTPHHLDEIKNSMMVSFKKGYYGIIGYTNNGKDNSNNNKQQQTTINKKKKFTRSLVDQLSGSARKQNFLLSWCAFPNGVF